MKGRSSILIALLLAVVLCSAARDVHAQFGGATADPLPGQPRMNGSTTAIPLGQLLTARALGLKGELRRIPLMLRRDGGASGKVSSLEVVFPHDTSPLQIEKYNKAVGPQTGYAGTNGAYMALIEDDADLIVVAREPSVDELKAAHDRKVILDARPIALDAFVFLVNSENPLNSLTLDQIRGIYTGTVKAWHELGGKTKLIDAFTRNPNSGSEELMHKLVMQGSKIIEGGDRMVMTMGGPIERVAINEDAIAYSVYYYEHIMSAHPKNKLLTINGIAPTPENIGSRRYPLTAEVYVVTRKGIDRSTPAGQMRDWLLSDEGQQLIAASGYVSVKPLTISKTGAASTP